MKRKDVLEVVIDSIRIETDFSGLIDEKSNAQNVDGWDSLAHVRIMFGVDIALGTTIDISQTYGIADVGELVNLFVDAIAEISN
ncbi:MAG: hypothetical protein H8D82_02115 [Euryarchaeota archaeon]|nr:hypothetical protein [Euryarchaeota archaeon]